VQVNNVYFWSTNIFVVLYVDDLESLFKLLGFCV